MSIQTVNATIAEVEDALRAGRKIEDVARDFMEPRNNVIAIWHAMRQRGEDAEVAPTRPVVVAPEPEAEPDETPADLPALREQARQIVQPRAEFKARATNAVELLARADSIEDRRVQSALGRTRKAMTDLAGLVTAYEENGANRRRIAELEAELRALRGGVTRSGKSGGPGKSSRPVYEGGPVPSVVRAWAKENGYEPRPSGRLQPEIVAAYRAAHGAA